MGIRLNRAEILEVAFFLAFPLGKDYMHLFASRVNFLLDPATRARRVFVMCAIVGLNSVLIDKIGSIIDSATYGV